MKVYVEKKELDTSILDTISDKCGTYVLVSEDKNNPKKDSLVFYNLTDYTKQVRKEVCKEFKEKFEKRNNGIRYSNHSEKYKDGYSGCCCDVEEILDQIQGETK